MSINPFITIVTVCYNSEKTIERTIKSVLSQQFTDYEYLIVDGVSKDTTLSIIQKYEPLFNGHMKWRSEPDKGIYDAFNKGCKWASGKYVWIVNSDDYMEPDALTKIWEVDQQQNTQQAKNTILIGRMNYISVDGTLLFVSKTISSEDLARAYRHDSMGLTHPATIVPKSIYEKVGYYDDRFQISADIDWFNRAYKAGIDFYGFSAVVTNMTDGGVSGTLSLIKESKDRLLSFKKKYNNTLVVYLHLYRWYLIAFKNQIHRTLRKYKISNKG